jgi:hypothetical protein
MFLSDGCSEYLPEILGNFGVWVAPECRQDKGPMPKPRWMPLPPWPDAQAVKAYRRRRLMGVKRRVVFGTMERVKQVLSACSWQVNTALVERRNLGIRWRVATVG